MVVRQVILPALKAGRALWVDEVDDASSPGSTNAPVTPKTATSKLDSDDDAPYGDQQIRSVSKRANKARGAKEDAKGKYKLDVEEEQEQEAYVEDDYEEEESDEVLQSAVKDVEDEGMEDASIAAEVEEGDI
jgi:hypothetical protein